MTTTPKHSIKALTNFRKLPPETLLQTSTTVHTNMDGNPNFIGTPAPPVEMATLKSANDALAAANAAAQDGGKKAVAQRNHQRVIVVKLLIQLAHYVEANCKDDMTIFLSSGFKPISSIKTKTPPVSESIRKIEPGSKTGEMSVTLMPYPGAGSYEVRWAPLNAGGVPGAWAGQPAVKVQSALTISGLTPGTSYVFQARAVTKTGYTNWGESITRIAT